MVIASGRVEVGHAIVDIGTVGQRIWRQKMKAMARLRLAFDFC